MARSRAFESKNKNYVVYFIRDFSTPPFLKI